MNPSTLLNLYAPVCPPMVFRRQFLNKAGDQQTNKISLKLSWVSSSMFVSSFKNIRPLKKFFARQLSHPIFAETHPETSVSRVGDENGYTQTKSWVVGNTSLQRVMSVWTVSVLGLENWGLLR